MDAHVHSHSYPESCSLTCQVFAGPNPSCAFLRHLSFLRGLGPPGQTSAATHQHTQAASSPTAAFFTEGLKQRKENNKKKKSPNKNNLQFMKFCSRLPARPACQTAKLLHHLQGQPEAKPSCFGAFRAGSVPFAHTQHGLQAVDRYLETFIGSVSFDTFNT